ncbi:hypothetical protein NQZ68_034378 [Dissostichus eleginoides]|nr:hypothetical protein NQZ68_034378 [Dissostichus eleginoides]
MATIFTPVLRRPRGLNGSSQHDHSVLSLQQPEEEEEDNQQAGKPSGQREGSRPPGRSFKRPGGEEGGEEDGCNVLVEL